MKVADLSQNGARSGESPPAYATVTHIFPHESSFKKPLFRLVITRSVASPGDLRIIVTHIIHTHTHTHKEFTTEVGLLKREEIALNDQPEKHTLETKCRGSCGE